MTLDMALAFAVMGGAVGLFIWGKLRYDLVAISALLVGALVGVIPLDRMFSGFANDLIWIIASALLLSAAIARSRLLDRVFEPILSRLTSPTLQVPAFAGAVMLLSMVTKNIGALAIMMPIAISSARRAGTAPSRLLMPMAFASLLGGIVTVFGTSPNLVVSSVRESMLGQPFQVFDFAPVGLGVCLVGFIFLAVAPFFIRIERPSPPSIETALENAWYTTELTIPAGSTWVGRPFGELDTLAGDEAEITSLLRDDDPDAEGRPAGDFVLAANDRVLVQGRQAILDRFTSSTKFTITGARHRSADPRADHGRVVEGVIALDSILGGFSAAQAQLYERYGLSLLAVAREGERITRELRSFPLRGGDVVIFKADEGRIAEAFAELRILPLSERALALGARRFGYAPLLLMGAAILAIGLGWAPIQLAFPAAAAGVLLLRVMSMEEAYRSIDGSLLVLLACLIPISDSIERTGGAALLAAPLADILAPLPPWLAVGTLIVVGMAVTPFLNNAATVLIVAPIAAAVASSLNRDPDPYLMAVAIGAASDFLTPIGHQSNTLVMGPGGYRFGDYWRLGLPLSVLVVVTATPLIMYFWG